MCGAQASEDAEVLGKLGEGQQVTKTGSQGNGLRFPLKTRQVMSEVIYLNRYERELLLKTRGLVARALFFMTV